MCMKETGMTWKSLTEYCNRTDVDNMYEGLFVREGPRRLACCLDYSVVYNMYELYDDGIYNSV